MTTAPRGRARPRDDASGVGGDVVEGLRAVRELLAARRRRVREVTVATDPGTRRAGLLEEILDLAREAGVRVRRVTPDSLRSMARTDAPQGVIARAAPIRPVEASALLAAPRPFVVALDGVTDPGNLGAVIRTASSAGATGIVVSRHRSARLSPAAMKAAAGAAEYLPLATVGGIPSFLDRARAASLWTVGLDERAEQTIFGLAVGDAPLALVLGAEGAGLARLTRARCDVVASIPMSGAVPSLNVAAAAAVACFEVARVRRG